jgi:hypothetical protein
MGGTEVLFEEATEDGTLLVLGAVEDVEEATMLEVEIAGIRTSL